MMVATLTAGLASQAAYAQSSRERRSSSDDSQYRRGAPEESRGRGAAGFEAFGLLELRNIFDSQRQPRVSGYAPPAQATPTAPVAESFVLRGVLLDQGDAVAFFEGSSPEYNASVKLGGIIGGHKLVEIRTDRVMLTSTRRKMELPVAFQMSHRSGGDWEVTTETTPVISSSPMLPTPAAGAPGTAIAGTSGSLPTPGATRMAPAGSPPAAGAPAPSGGSADDMLKRLMERRRKEMGQ
jgi:hypothetical protein